MGSSIVIKLTVPVALVLILLTQVVAQENIDNKASVIRELRSSRDQIKSFFQNCTMESIAYTQYESERRDVTSHSYAAKGARQRLDEYSTVPSSRDYCSVHCISSESKTFKARKKVKEGAFAVTGTSKPVPNTIETINSIFRLSSAAYGCLNFDLLEEALLSDETEFKNIETKEEAGKQLLTFRFRKKSWADDIPFLAVSYVKFSGARVWVMEEYDFGSGYSRKEYNGLEDGIPLIESVRAEYFAGFDKKTRSEFPMYTEVREVVRFSSISPPDSYFKFEGLNISINQRFSLSLWLALLAGGIATFVVATWFRSRLAQDRNPE